MELTFNDGKMFYNIMDCVGSIVSEVKIQITPEALIIMGFDGSHICLIHLEINKADWQSYQCAKTEEMGINMDDFLKILKRNTSKDTIVLSIDKKQLVITSKKAEKKSTRKFKISMIDLEQEEINISTLDAMELPIQFSVDLAIIEEALNDAEIYNECLTFKVDKNQLLLSTESTIGDMEYQLDSDELLSDESRPNQLKQSAENTYAIQFLKSILKGKNLSKSGFFKTKNECPLYLRLEILEHSFIEYWLAPRVETDDPAQDPTHG